MRTFAFALGLILSLGGCATAAPQATPSSAVAPTAPQLAGTQWRFVSVQGKSIPDDVHATLRFDDKGRASGRAGCNSYGASFLAGGDGALHFGQMLSTKMACLQPAGAMETERGVMDALSRTAHARVQNGEMTLLDVTGTAVAALKAQQ
ncbi:MAG TPA: META domain-containing protein [Rhodanobacteraceae bacterium]|nr:META domain-containing protein [Rhodanobacteraceae bacterium]